MINYVSRRALLLWALMAVFTCLTCSIGGGHWFTPTMITATVLAIAFVKMRFIGSDFMELRAAPPPLAVCYDVYLATVYIALMGMYVLL